MTELFHREGYAIKIILALSYWLVAKYTTVKEAPGPSVQTSLQHILLPRADPRIWLGNEMGKRL